MRKFVAQLIYLKEMLRKFTRRKKKCTHMKNSCLHQYETNVREEKSEIETNILYSYFGGAHCFVLEPRLLELYRAYRPAVLDLQSQGLVWGACNARIPPGSHITWFYFVQNITSSLAEGDRYVHDEFSVGIMPPRN